MKLEIPEGFTRTEIEETIKLWEALEILVENDVMPDVDMDVQQTDIYTDRWFNIGLPMFCITNKEGEKPHLADVVELWDGENEIETYSIADLREML